MSSELVHVMVWREVPSRMTSGPWQTSEAPGIPSAGSSPCWSAHQRILSDSFLLWIRDQTLLNIHTPGLPCQSSSSDAALSGKEAWVQTPVEELRSRMSHTKAKQERKKENTLANLSKFPSLGLGLPSEKPYIVHYLYNKYSSHMVWKGLRNDKPFWGYICCRTLEALKHLLFSPLTAI